MITGLPVYLLWLAREHPTQQEAIAGFFTATAMEHAQNDQWDPDKQCVISIDDLDLLLIGEGDESNFAKPAEPETGVECMEVDMAQVKDDAAIKLADSNSVSTWNTLPGPPTPGSSAAQHSIAHTTHSGLSASKQSMHSHMDSYESSMASVMLAIKDIQQTIQQPNPPPTLQQTQTKLHPTSSHTIL